MAKRKKTPVERNHDSLVKFVVESFRRKHGQEWRVRYAFTEAVAESLVAAELMALIQIEEAGCQVDEGLRAKRSLYYAVYREACSKLFSWCRNNDGKRSPGNSDRSES